MVNHGSGHNARMRKDLGQPSAVNQWEKKVEGGFDVLFSPALMPDMLRIDRLIALS